MQIIGGYIDGMKQGLLFVILFIGNVCYGQTLIGSAGNGGNQLVNFSLGEAFINGGNTGSNQITQGFQQPNLWGVKIQEQDHFTIKAFPNPVESFLVLSCSSELDDVHEVQLHASDGKLVKSFILNQQEMTLDFSDFSAGTYILIVTKQGTQVASYRIIKTK